MFEYEFTVTEDGILGTLPCGEQHLFATEEDYYEAYTDEENEIVDNLFELNNGYEYEMDYNGGMYA